MTGVQTCALPISAYTILHTDDFSVKGILNQAKKSTELSQRYLSRKDKLRKTWNNWMRLRRKRVHRPANGEKP